MAHQLNAAALVTNPPVDVGTAYDGFHVRPEMTREEIIYTHRTAKLDLTMRHAALWTEADIAAVHRLLTATSLSESEEKRPDAAAILAHARTEVDGHFGMAVFCKAEAVGFACISMSTALHAKEPPNGQAIAGRHAEIGTHLVIDHMIVNTFLYEAMVKPVKSGPEVVSFCAVVRRILYNAFCFLELQNLAESWIFVHCDNTAIARGVIADGLAFGAGPVAGTNTLAVSTHALLPSLMKYGFIKADMPDLRRAYAIEWSLPPKITDSVNRSSASELNMLIQKHGGLQNVSRRGLPASSFRFGAAINETLRARLEVAAKGSGPAYQLPDNGVCIRVGVIECGLPVLLAIIRLGGTRAAEAWAKQEDQNGVAAAIAVDTFCLCGPLKQAATRGPAPVAHSMYFRAVHQVMRLVPAIAHEHGSGSADVLVAGGGPEVFTSLQPLGFKVSDKIAIPNPPGEPLLLAAVSVKDLEKAATKI